MIRYIALFCLGLIACSVPLKQEINESHRLITLDSIQLKSALIEVKDNSIKEIADSLFTPENQEYKFGDLSLNYLQLLYVENGDCADSLRFVRMTNRLFIFEDFIKESIIGAFMQDNNPVFVISESLNKDLFSSQDKDTTLWIKELNIDSVYFEEYLFMQSWDYFRKDSIFFLRTSDLSLSYE